MALQKQNIEIPLGVGVDTITDSKQIKPGKLAWLENAVFAKVGRLTKRNGLVHLTQDVTGSTAISAAKGLACYGDELGLYGENTYYAYSDAQAKWIAKGGVYGIDVTSRLLARPLTSNTMFDVACGGGLILYVTAGSLGPLAYVVDQTTGEIVLPETMLSLLTPTSVRVVYYGSQFYVYYAVSTGVFVRRYDPSSPGAFQTEATVLSGASYIQVVPKMVGTQLAVLSVRKTTLEIGFVDSTGTYSASTTSIATSVAPLEFRGCNFYASYTGVPSVDGVFVAFTRQDTGTLVTKIDARVLATDLTTLTSEFVVSSSGTLPSMGYASSNRATLIYYNDLSGTSSVTNDFQSRIAILTRAGAVASDSIFVGSAVPASDVFQINSRTYVIMNVISTIQPGYLLVETAAGINSFAYQTWGSFSYQEATTSVGSISGVAFLSATKIVWCSGRAARRNSADYGFSGGVVDFTTFGPQSTTISIDPSQGFRPIQFGLNQFAAAGTLWSYDGVRNVEASFRYYPDAVSAADGSAGSIAAGTYSYVVIYEWTDSRGQIYRSAPSIPIQHTAAASKRVVLKWRNLLYTNKPDAGATVYRTVKDGTTYYRVGTTYVSSPTVTTISFTDNTTDANLVDNEIIYTAGGVLENIPPPTATFSFSYGNRLFVIGLEDENACRYSRTYVPGESPYFNDALELRVDEGAGGLVAGGALDDRVIFFKRSSTYFTAGDGPTDTGAQNDFRSPQRISADVGCTDPASVIRVPAGLIFKSAKGFYLLDRGMNMQYIGADVDDYNSLVVTGAVHIESKNQVRFTHSSGAGLVYDYLHGQWGTFTNHSGQASVQWRGRHAIVSSSGLVKYEDPTIYLDNGAAVPIKVVTPWIPLAGLQGFQRVYEAAILGENLSAHTLQVRIAYDYNDTYVQTLTGLSSVLTNGVEQFKVKPARQKCQAIKFEITDINPIPTAGACLTLSGLTLTIGVKGGINRTKATQALT